LTIYRIASAKHPENDGKGAWVAGGRWNLKGTAVVYCSQTASLAALEVLAHSAKLPNGTVEIAIDVPDSLAIEIVEISDLPANWAAAVAPPATKRIGTRWVKSGSTAVLSVPSAIVPHERNFLLNPAHRDFADILFHDPQRFRFDPRLK
jgi:RES domain-containing protein